MLDRFFHYKDRGSSFGREFAGGLLMFFLTVCVLFMNMQVLGNILAGDAELVNAPQNAGNIEIALLLSSLYAGCSLATILGTLLLGIVANLPLTTISVIGFSGMAGGLLGLTKGFTYENLLFSQILASVISVVFFAVPKLSVLMKKCMTPIVRKMLVTLTGLWFCYGAIRLSGIFPLTEMSSLKLSALIGSVVAVILYIVLGWRKKKGRVMLSLLSGTLVYYLVALIKGGIDTSNRDSVINFGRVWLIAGSQASRTTPFADSYLTYSMSALKEVFARAGALLKEGVDFSGFSGNAGSQIAIDVVVTLVIVLVLSEGSLSDVGASENEERKALLSNGIAGIIGSFFGSCVMAISPVSAAAKRNQAKTGLASVVAGLFLLVSLFILVFPALFATMTYEVTSMNQWNYFAYGNGGFVYLVREVVFTVVDVVMACVGLSMVKDCWLQKKDCISHT